MAFELLEFTADWCAPCKQQKPILEKISEEHGLKLRVINIDKASSSKLCDAHNITSVPTTILTRDGSVVAKWEGLTTVKKIVEKLTEPVDGKVAWSGKD